ncbi:hypothetical protein B0H11DRAFT_1986249 [Mycena galericulata]|nr:hypothetical protein B0H11DRAFT_1986249 [Mycena galericulata]
MAALRHTAAATAQRLKSAHPSLTYAAAAQRAADSVLCSSVLAGHSSESDEFGDVAVWLGPGAFGKGNEQAVLKKLGLEHGARVGPLTRVERV